TGAQMNGAAVVIGCMLIAGSIPMRHRMTHPFGTQLALVLSSTGQILIIGGVRAGSRPGGARSLPPLPSSIPLSLSFPDRVQRFSAPLIVFGALITIAIDQKIPHGLETIVLLAAALLVGLCRFAPRAEVQAHAAIVEPVVYGTACALIGLLITHTVILLGEIFEMRWASLGLAAVVGLNLALLTVVETIFLEHDVPITRPEPLLAFAGIIALGA